MTLKDKFDNPLMRHDLGRNEIEETKEQCAEVAEEFAIGFIEWIINKEYHIDIWVKNNSTKELLEIYKKTL